jgi:hypothetical protein
MNLSEEENRRLEDKKAAHVNVNKTPCNKDLSILLCL